jgi:DNA-directed RNA polymerase II subunit RPB1
MSAIKDFSFGSKINAVSFYIMGNDENETDSNVVLTNKELFKADFPVPEGIYDAHMGTTDQLWLCETCGNNKSLCPGHSGSIELNYPVKSPIFKEYILKWLKIICFKCGSLVTKHMIKASKNKIMSEYIKYCRTVINCEYCNEPHPNVVKDKIQQVVFYSEINTGKIVKRDELFNHIIKNVLNKISNQTLKMLGIPERSHPKNFILNTIRVAPNTIRPVIRKIGNNRSGNSDITALTKNIIEINTVLPINIPANNLISKELREMYFNLDISYYEMIKGSTGSGNQIRVLTNTNKTPNSIANRIPKKEGRIRRNLMGKRVRYMMRSVITGDNMLKVDEVGVPIGIARSIQIPETVRSYNKEITNTYFMNKNKAYPGCSSIIKKGTNKVHKIEYLDSSYQLQEGDIIMRDLITGDTMGFNRQPSLLFSSISAVKIVVLEQGNALRMNVSSCPLYNADFDGDQMNGIIPQNIQSRNEISKLSSVGNWMVSYKNGSPFMGAYQDSLIGMVEFTRSDVYLDRFHAMKVLSQIDPHMKNFKFTKNNYQSRELISMFMPRINLPKKNIKLYKPQYAPYIKYDPNDIEVQINRGELISGILDKATIGPDTMGSIFHIINNEYGSKKTLDTIYSIQQLSTSFFINYGFTIGIKDIVISDSSIQKIKDKTAAMILESRILTKKLNKNKIIAPIGMTLFEYFEMEQINTLEQGDDFVEPILASIDFKSNKLAKLVFSGSKGKETNVISINGALGSQTINGARMTRNCGWGRTSPYFLRHDMEPKSLGYIAQSYKEGILSDIYPFAAAEARYGEIIKALSTSVAGYQNRLSIKNLESILVDNLYKSVKDQNLIQPIYADSGFDIRKTEKVKFLTIMLSNKDMEAQYKTKITDLNKMYNNKAVKEALENEYVQLLEDRNLYRSIFLKIETDNLGKVIFDNTRQMPINIFRLIEDTIYNYKDEMTELSKDMKIIDPIKSIKKITELCNILPYAYFNGIQERNNMKIPEYIRTATLLSCILIRSYLCTANLIKKNINDKLLDIIITKIRIIYKKALVNYGTSVGIIAAQCISEPMTQYMLDTKHRSGAGLGTRTSTIVRLKEIFGAKHTDSMKNPSMILIVDPKYEFNKSKVQEIANYIEMMEFSRFVVTTHIFFEEYGNPVHSEFKNEKKIIDNFIKYNNGIDVPNDLTFWCIRFQLNKEELIINSMKLDTIILELQKNHEYLFIVYTPENHDSIILRCYIRNNITKTANINSDYIINTMKKIKSTVIRGVPGIKTTNVINIIKSFIEDDGAITNKVTYGINTLGTNLEKIMENTYLDKYKCQTDSILEFEEMFGIDAARQKIIAELRNEMSDISIEHCTIFADEMTYSGHVTSIHKTGLQKREMSNVSLRMSFQSPIQVVENAAVDGLVDKLSGISGPLVLGAVPNIGTRYNKIIVNEKFIKGLDKKTLDDL